jgi:Mn-containing catalase
MKDVRLAGSFLSNGGGAMPMNSNAASWTLFSMEMPVETSST